MKYRKVRNCALYVSMHNRKTSIVCLFVCLSHSKCQNSRATTHRSGQGRPSGDEQTPVRMCPAADDVTQVGGAKWPAAHNGRGSHPYHLTGKL